MQKIRIGYDLDGVIAKTTFAWSLTKKIINSPLGRSILRCLSYFAPVNLRPFNNNYFENYIITGRLESDRKITEAWLKMHKINYHLLIMNPYDFEHIKEFKAEAINMHKLVAYIEDNEEIASYLSYHCPETAIILISQVRQNESRDK